MEIIKTNFVILKRINFTTKKIPEKNIEDIKNI